MRYPHFLVNGRTATHPTSSPAARRRGRFRMINAAADTAFRVALGGHRMTVTHTDGFPVQPVTVDTLLIGMGERYDIVRRWRRVRSRWWRPRRARAQGVRRGAYHAGGRAPPPNGDVAELQRRLSYQDCGRPCADHPVRTDRHRDAWRARTPRQGTSGL